MARNARYRVPFRRRREGKTNYHLRRRLLRSNRIRAVIRVTNSHCLVQFVQARITGDNTLSAAHSRELSNFNWNGATSNLPSAYLVGLLAGLRAKKNGIQDAILDIGLNSPTYGSRVFTTLKGIIDSGIDIPHSEKVFPDENRLNGQHIADYAKLLKKENEKQYKSQFSKYIKLKIDPSKITEIFDKTVEEIKTNFQ